MADLKISQLPAASTPLGGTEVLPLVQGGETKKVTVSELRATSVTGVTATAPVVSSGGLTPNISMAAASTSTNGYLTSTDWNTFNSKQPAGAVTSVTGTAPVVSSGGATPAISMAAATTSVSGYLTSTDWNTFNNKYSTGGALGTPSSATLTNATGLPLTTGVTGLLPVANGGTGTATPALVAGSNVTITGTWPNQTIASTGATGTVTSVATGTGLTGGPITASGTISLADTAVTAGTYTAANITVDAQGRITAAANGSGGGGGTVTSVAASVPSFLSVTGSPITTAGTLAISYSGTALPVANGGTGVTTSTGSGSVVLSTSPTLVTPILGTPTSGTLTNATGLPLTTGVTGLLPVANGGTGTATPALVAGTNVTITGTWPNQTINSSGGAGGVTTFSAGTTGFTPSTATSGAVTLAGTLATTNGGTGLTSFTANGVVYASSTSALTTGSALTFDGTNFSTTGSATGTAFIPSGSTVPTNGMYLPTTNTVAWSTNTTERMRLDFSGNLGLGVTPSAWSGGYKALDLNAASLEATTGAGNVILSNNSYYNGSNWIYKATGVASDYVQTSGQHWWRTAPSGTAGNAISFTQAMTLDASGNLLVGTTGTGARMRVDSAGSTSSTNIVQFNNSSVVEAFRVRSDGAIFTGSSGSGLAACPYNNTTANAANMVVGTGGDLQRSTSALKYKQDIRDLESIDISKFRPVRYKSKCDNDDQAKDHFGFIADEVDAAGVKELVSYGENGEVEGFQYDRMTTVLLKAIQEQQAIIESLTTRLTALEGKA